METVTLQPQTLISLTALIKSWNQDPLALNNSLIITKDTAIVTDGITILFSLQLSIEDTDPLQNDSYTETTIELPSNEELVLLPEDNAPESIEAYEPNMEPDSVLTRIKEDLMNTEASTVTRATPLLTFTWRNQTSEIISRLNQETRGSQREKQIQILEACYYLGKLRQDFQDNYKVTKEIKKDMRATLGSYRTHSTWKCAERAYQVFSCWELSKLYQTQYISLNSINKLSNEEFAELMELGTHGVRS